MPTVNELLAADDTGHVWLLDVSFDDFASVAYRWSTASVRVSGNDYDGRIASMTAIDRSFGRDHLPAATTTKLRITNDDFAADWLIDRVTVGSSLLKARFRLIVYLYDARSYTAADSLSGAAQTIGIFTCLDQPEAMDHAVDLTLADDSLGRLAEPLTTPTVRDNPLGLFPSTPTLGALDVVHLVPLLDWDVPLPLVFGLGNVGVQVPAYSAIANFRTSPEEGDGALKTVSSSGRPPIYWPLVVCAAKADTQPAGVDEIVELHATFAKDLQGATHFNNGDGAPIAGATLEIPRTFKPSLAGGPLANSTTPVEIWRPMRTAAFSKGGRSWQIVWVEFNVDMYAEWWRLVLTGFHTTTGGGNAVANPWPLGGPSTPAVAAAEAAGGFWPDSRGHIMAAIERFHVRSGPRGHLSMVTRREAPDVPGDYAPSQLLVDMIYDAIAYYSKATTADMDATAFARAVKARATVHGAGIIQPARPRPVLSIQRNGWISPNPRDGIVGILRTALGDMCGSADVDLFMTKEGLYSLSTNVFDFTAVTATRVEVTESRTHRPRTRTPSDGERWAPYNRVMLVGPGGASFGPYDNQTAIDSWGVIKPVTLNAKWNARLWGENSAAGASTVWAYRTLESKVRPAIRFGADREYLALELGEYFEYTWSRGGQSAFFSDTVFRLEGMRIDPETLKVDLSAIWADDLGNGDAAPFLLDNETLVVRASGSAARTATVTDSDATVVFSSGDLTADGVAAGDILILKDSSLAANVFTRYRALYIDSVTDATHLVVNEAAPDFDAPGGVAVGEWEIRRGATTYHTAITDPVNYPSGGAMYGKCCDTNNNYSDSGFPTNRLLEG